MKSTSLEVSYREACSSRAAIAAAIALVALSPAGCNRANRSNSTLVLSGNIEVVDAQLSFKIPGRVVRRLVSEGDRVKGAELIATLDDSEQTETAALRRAELRAAEAALAELKAGSRPQEIAASAATLRSAEAERDRARLDFDRQKDLLERAAISRSAFDAAQAGLKVAEARVAEAEQQLALVRQGPRVETIEQAKARVEQARASLALAETQVANTRLLSPLTGVVLSHDVEPGEFVGAGTPVVTVADLDHVWVRTYLPQTDLDRVRHGEHVAVRTDAYPGKTYNGVVGFISSEAEFTPKTVQTPKERVKLMFRVKVDITNRNDELKPGMAADVTLPPPTGS